MRQGYTPHHVYNSSALNLRGGGNRGGGERRRDERSPELVFLRFSGESNSGIMPDRVRQQAYSVDQR